MRERLAAALLGLLLLSSPAQGGGTEDLLLAIDGLYCARALTAGDACYVPVRALCTALGLPMAWAGDETDFTLTLGSVTVTGKAGQEYLEADGRYLWAPEGWRVKDGELYLPLAASEKLFGARARRIGRELRFATADMELLRGGEDYYALHVPADDFYWLCHIIHAEAGVEPMAGKIGVGNVVFNRIKSADFPDTVFEVIFDTEHAIQFEPISYSIIQEDPFDSDVIAACLVLEGADTVGDCTYFVNPDYGSAWFDRALDFRLKIGSHNFYAEGRADADAGTDAA